MENSGKTKVGELVTRDFRTAAVFKKAGIDFCCGGNQTLEEACKSKNLDMEQIQQALLHVEGDTLTAQHRFNEWKLDFLCDYIVNIHHQRVRKWIPELTAYTQKIARVHGANHPELDEIAKQFTLLSQKLLKHLDQEERVLFPAIKEALNANSSKTNPLLLSEINRMTNEHEFAGETMDHINELSKAYRFPSDACNTYRITYKLLEEFEDDLHVHVHLENNILYPKALMLV